MSEKQLNVWIPQALRDYIADRAKQESRGMNAIIEELIQQDITRRNGEIVEQQSLPVIREIVRAEVRQATADLRRELRQDRELERSDLEDFLRSNVNRLAALMVQAIRNAGVSRRLLYTLLSKAYGSPFAQAAYEDAKEKMSQELLPRKNHEELHS